LSLVISLEPEAMQVRWATDNEGNETPHGMMTSIAELVVLPVLP
jgi:hypothetical protein